MAALVATKPLYLADTYLYRSTARVLQIIKDSYSADSKKTGTAVVILDQTVFYPQGGGQPSDVGLMSLGESRFQVNMVRTDAITGLIQHEGHFYDANHFAPGDEVHLEVDSQVRMENAQCHSAGHLLDHATQRLELPLLGTKAYHFSAGPYVEYRITDKSFDASPAALERIRVSVERVANEIIAEARPIHVQHTRPCELSEETRAGLAEKLRALDHVRLIVFDGFPSAIPCGGTHVRNTSELGRVSIKKVSVKGGETLRMSYSSGAAQKQG